MLKSTFVASEKMYSGDEGRDTLSRNHINALTADLVVVLPVAPAHSLNSNLLARSRQ